MKRKLLGAATCTIALLLGAQLQATEVPFYERLTGDQSTYGDGLLLSQFCPAALWAESDLLLEGVRSYNFDTPEKRSQRIKENDERALHIILWRLEDEKVNTPEIIAFEIGQRHKALRAYRAEGLKAGAVSLEDYRALTTDLFACASMIKIR